MDQTHAPDNGIYVVGAHGDNTTPFHLNRAPDANTLSGGSDLRRAATYITEGSTYSGRGYTQSSDITAIGTDPVVFHLFATISEISATDGLTMQGKNVAVNVDSARGMSIVNDKVAIIDKGVTSSLIDDGAVQSLQLADGAVLPGKLAENCINSASKFTAGVVDADTLASACVTTAKMAPNAVTTAKILTSAVTRDKIAESAIDGTKMEAGSVGAEQIADGSITSVKIGGGQVSASNIGAGAVGTPALAAAAVQSSSLATASIITSKVAPQNITTALLNQAQGNQAVSTETMRDDCVTHEKIASDAVSADQLQASSVTESKLADNSVSQRTLGTFNSLTVNGPVSATSFVAGGSAGSTSMGLCRAVHHKTSFDNNSYSLTTSLTQVPTSATQISFAYDDDIAAVFINWGCLFATDGSPQEIETVVKIQYFRNDGSELLENEDYVIDHFQFQTDQEQGGWYGHEGSQTTAVKKSAAGGGADYRIGNIWLEMRKIESGPAFIPVGADLHLIALVIAEDSNATLAVY